MTNDAIELRARMTANGGEMITPDTLLAAAELVAAGDAIVTAGLDGELYAEVAIADSEDAAA